MRGGRRGYRCEANTNVPGAPRILDPPLSRAVKLLGVITQYKSEDDHEFVVADIKRKNFVW